MLNGFVAANTISSEMIIVVEKDPFREPGFFVVRVADVVYGFAQNILTILISPC